MRHGQPIHRASAGTVRVQPPAPRAWRSSAATALRALVAAVVTGAAAALLAHVAARLGRDVPAVGTGRLEGWVAVCAVGVGAVAMVVMATGCLLTAVGAVGRGVGRTLAGVERLAARLTPVAVRRVVALGLGAALTVGVTGPVVAQEQEPGVQPGGAVRAGEAPLDLGWAVTADDGGAEPAESPAGPSPAVAPSTSQAPADAAPPAGTAPGAPLVDTSPPAAAATAEPTELPSAAAPTTVVVAPGDSLWSITADLLPGAGDAAIAAAWPRLYAANSGVVGADPDLIHPGQVLTIAVEELS